MQYWRSVLNEVVYKDDSPAFLFTNQGRLDLETDTFITEDLPIKVKPKIKEKETRDLRAYYLGSEFHDIYLTKREAECMFWMIQEYTIPQAAEKMALSARTVEFYVKNLKLKLHCKNKKELLEKILKSGLLKQLEKDGMRLTKH